MNSEKSNAFSDSGLQKVMINSGKATLKIHFRPFQEIEWDIQNSNKKGLIYERMSK